MQHLWPRRRRVIAGLCLTVLLVVPALQGWPVAAAQKRVMQVTIKDLGRALVVGIVATGQIQFQMVEFTNPPRVAIDIPGAVVDDELRVTTVVNKGTVLRIRVGQFQDSPPIARIVIDLARPVAVDVGRSGSNVLVVTVPMQPLTTSAPAPSAGGSRASPPSAPPPAVSAPPGTGLVKTAQVPPGTPAGVIRLLEFRNVPLADVLSALAKLCGFNLVTDGSVQGAITLRLVDVTCEDALRFILEANGLGFRRLGRNIIITSAKSLEPPAEVPETIAYRLAYGDVTQVRAAIAAAVSGVRVAVDTRTNALLITGTAAQHQEVLKVLATLDIRIPQVVVQVHVIEVSRTNATDLGLLSSVPGGGDTGFAKIIVDSAQNRVTFSLVDATLILFRLQALATERRVRVLAAPRIATLDGNKASILLGDQFPVITSIPAGGTVTQTVTFVPIGVKLEVTPRINADGFMTIGLKPEVSSVTDIVTTTQGTRAPQIATRSAETTLTVKDGQTIVLGGLITQEERRSVIKVPLLGDIPILGELFRVTTRDVRENELIFLITPTIVKETP